MILVAALAAAAGAQNSFVERAEAVGIHHKSLAGMDRVGQMAAGIVDWVQTGVGIGDLDGDGDPDVVLAGGLLPNHVFRNDGGRFTDVTSLTGMHRNELDRCVAIGDYDNDGDLDVYLGALRAGTHALEGRGRLYRNEGDFQFTDVTDLAGVASKGHSTFAQFYDVDRDGLLDLYVCEFHVTKNAFFINNGDGTFSDAGGSLAVEWPGSAHASSFLDSDGDGSLDLFVGNDWLVSSIAGLPGNYGDAQLAGSPAGVNAPFSDVSAGSGHDVTRGIMGFCWGDPDYDGDLDLYKTDVGANYLFMNHGWPSSGQAWTQGEVQYGIEAGLSPWHENPGTFGINSSWAPLFFSADFDLWDDFFVTNGHVAGMNPGMSHLPRHEPNEFYWGQGPGQPFVEDAVGAGLYDEVDDRGMAAGDMDQDGDLDLLITATKARARYFENHIDPDGQGWLQVVADSTTSGAGGIGAIVRWTDSGGHVHTRALGSDAPTASNHEVLAHFGMGNEPSADVEVTFPSGLRMVEAGVLPNSRIVVTEPLLFELSERVLPIASVAGAGIDRLTVDAHAHDVNGARLGPATSVLIEAAGLTPMGPVQHIVGNHFRRDFVLPDTPGTYPIDLMFDGWTPEVRPHARFRGGLSPSGTTVNFHPTAVRAGTSDSFELVVCPKDDLGYSLGDGFTIQLDVSGCAPLGQVVDHGDGRYSRTFQAPASPGRLVPTVSLGPATMPSAVTIDAAAGAAVRTQIMLEHPTETQSMSQNEVRVCVIPRDAAGRRLGPGAKVELDILVAPDPSVRVPIAPVGQRIPVTSAGASQGGPVGGSVGTAGSPQDREVVRLREDVDSTGQEDGEFLFIVAIDPDDPDGIAGTLRVRVDGELVGSKPFGLPPQ